MSRENRVFFDMEEILFAIFVISCYESTNYATCGPGRPKFSYRQPNGPGEAGNLTPQKAVSPSITIRSIILWPEICLGKRKMDNAGTGTSKTHKFRHYLMADGLSIRIALWCVSPSGSSIIVHQETILFAIRRAGS